jgi:hypothetical protein
MLGAVRDGRLDKIVRYRMKYSNARITVTPQF